MMTSPAGRDLARNEEFSEIAVINIFFTVLKKKPSYLWGGVLRGKFRDKSRNWRVNKQERYTSILIDLRANTLPPGRLSD